jgi:hypothetical protein
MIEAILPGDDPPLGACPSPDAASPDPAAVFRFAAALGP